MYITTVTRLERFVLNDQSVIGLQSKKQPDFNLQLLKIMPSKTERPCHVDLYRICLDSNMYLDSTGLLQDCLEKLDKNWNVFSFENFDEFYKWYLKTKKK